MRFDLRATLALVLLACGCTGPGRASASSGGARFPNVVLTTHENRQVRFYDDLVRGKVVLISFMFTSCQGVCPRTTANLLKVRTALGDHVGRDVFLYSITLDPDRDTPQALNRYAKAVGAGPGWLFLTGARHDLELLRHKLGAYDLDPRIDADKTQHGAMLVYGNDALDRWAMTPALANPELIVNAVRRVM